MKLIHAHIENFGTLQQYDISFHEGVNSILQENGWGKSTLAAFLRVMFFGFENDSRRNDIENERRHYMPWQNGVYGGSLTFEVQGKQYRIERSFLARNHDHFALYDAKTNLPSSDFSSNIGEELFDIDLRSFSNTIFIGQLQCSIADPTSRINAKIGDLSRETADMSMFEPANNQLQSELNALNPNRATGKLHKLNRKLAELKYEIEQRPGAERQYRELREALQKGRMERKKLEESLHTLNEKRNVLSAFLEIRAQKEKYENLQKELKEARREMDAAQEWFPGRIPREEELQALFSRAEALSEYSAEQRSRMLSAEEQAQYEALAKQFRNGVPDQASLEEISRNIQMLREFRRRADAERLTEKELRLYEQYRRRFAEGVPVTEETERFIQASRRADGIRQALPANKASLEALKLSLRETERAAAAYKAAGSRRSVGVFLIVLGVLAVIAGLAYYVVERNWLGLAGPNWLGLAAQNWLALVGPGVGAMLLLLGMLLLRQKHSAQEPAGRRTVRETVKGRNGQGTAEGRSGQEEPEGTAELPKNVQALSDKIQTDEAFLTENDHAVNAYLRKYGWNPNPEEYLNLLYELKADAEEYRELKGKQDLWQKSSVREKADALHSNIAAFFAHFGVHCQEEQFSEALYTLRNQIAVLRSIVRKRRLEKEAKRSQEEQASLLQESLEQYGFQTEGEIPLLLTEIRRRLDRLHAQEEQYQKRKKDIEIFEAENDVQSYAGAEAPDFPETMDQLSLQIREADAGKAQLEQELNRLERQAEELEQRLEGMEEAEEEYLAGCEEQESLSHRYEIISRTQEFLWKAKDSFLTHYMGPMQKAFDKYYTLLTGDETNACDLDANLNVTCVAAGEHRSIELLSEGYKDLVGLCRRMAMIEAMYKDKRPFLIFDDPFVNLDNQKTEYGLRFLQELGKEYQIIYLTCHSSREAE